MENLERAQKKTNESPKDVTQLPGVKVVAWWDLEYCQSVILKVLKDIDRKRVPKFHLAH